MPAEFHLAKDAFALHFSLQRLEGLIDIVVANENLHVVLLFNPTVDRPNTHGACGHGRADMRSCRLRLYTAPDRLGVEKLPRKLFRHEVYCV
jgi:hypothetical protein